MLTLRLRLLMLWLFTLALCIALGVILYSVYELGTEAQTGRTVSLASNACTALQTRYPRSLQPANEAVDPVLMTAVLNATLDDAPGVEGGFWHARSGFVAYAFPTHQGSTPKRDVPTTERDRIEALVRTTLSRAEPAVDLLHGSRETVVLTACPIDASGTVLGAWTMARVPLAVGKAYDALTRGLALLLLFVVGSGLWLSYSFFRWTRHFTRIENALSGTGPAGSTEIQRAGDAELDRVVVAVNQFSTRLAAAQREAEALNTSLERAERFAALGRMAASVAHEVRNPIAAIRLRAENALARPDKREANLTFVLREVERLEAIVKQFLSRAEPVRVQARDVAVRDWLAERMGMFSERCQAKAIELDWDAAVEHWRFDPVALARALDNLLNNALDHTPRGGAISVCAERGPDAQVLILRVCDTGPGVAEQVKPRLFEPFVSGRTDGMGLGLALAQEIALAHGGTARYVEQTRGACFELELPCAS